MAIRNRGQTKEDKAKEVNIDKIAADAAAKRKLQKKSSLETIQEALNNSQGRTFSTATLTLVTVVVLSFFAIRPAVVSITTQLEENRNLRTRIVSLDQKINTITSLQAVRENRSDDFALFETYLGDDEYQNLIYDEILEYLDDARLDFESISFDPEEIDISESIDIDANSSVVLDPQLKTQSVSISFNADRESYITDFLEVIEQDPRAYDVQSLNISAPNEDSEREYWTVRMTVLSFYWLDATAESDLTLPVNQ